MRQSFDFRLTFSVKDQLSCIQKFIQFQFQWNFGYLVTLHLTRFARIIKYLNEIIVKTNTPTASAVIFHEQR